MRAARTRTGNIDRNPDDAMDLRLNGMTALVTGSTGGIGLAIARTLAVEGAKVTIAGRTQAKLDQAAASIRAAGGAHVSAVLADAATAEGAATLLEATPLTAQLAISRGLAEMTKGTHVTVNSVLPGPTRSEGIVDFLRSLARDPQAPTERIEAEFFAKGRPSSLLQRLIEPEEIASLVAYLPSPLSSATNGAALRVDGGVIPTLG